MEAASTTSTSLFTDSLLHALLLPLLQRLKLLNRGAFLPSVTSLLQALSLLVTNLDGREEGEAEKEEE